MANKDLMRADRAQGMSYRQIGEKYGLSRQRVFQIIGCTTDRRESYFRCITEKDCIYPNIRKWMNDNKVSKAEFCRRVFGNSHSQNWHHISNWLGGRRYPLKKSIDKLIEVTGLTYEELFKE